MVARAIRFTRAHSRMGQPGSRCGPTVAVVRGRLWRRHRSLLHRRTRAGPVGGRVAHRAVRPCRRAAAPADRAFVVALGAFGIALGFTGATIKTALIDHPVLRFATSGVTVAGFVELREESQHTDRFVLRVERMEGGRMDDKPLRVRLSVKRGTAPPASRSKPRSTRRCNRSNQAANAHRICRNINYLYTSGLNGSNIEMSNIALRKVGAAVPIHPR
jgi:hypothetical protein